jgi:hypothetical protein
MLQRSVWPLKQSGGKGLQGQRSASAEVAIETTCWVPEDRLREFLEAVVAAAGVHGTVPGQRSRYGSVWLDKDRRLEQGHWDRIRELVELSDSLHFTWAGFSWRARGGDEVRCELQRDVGYSGVVVRLRFPVARGSAADVARQVAVALGGGIGQE